MSKGNGYWLDIQSENCPLEVMMNATNSTVLAIGNTLLRVCMNRGDDRSATIALLDAGFGSTRTSSLFGVLSGLIGKLHIGKKEMAVYVDAF